MYGRPSQSEEPRRRSLMRFEDIEGEERAAAADSDGGESAGAPIISGGGGGGSSDLLLQNASYEELSQALLRRLEDDRERAASKEEEVARAEERLREKHRLLEEVESRMFSASGDDLVDLNVGGHFMSTSRHVLCSAEGSLLASLFSGQYDDKHLRDKDGRIFLDLDPVIFGKLLSHFRLRRLASPEEGAPLPVVPEELKQDYDMMLRHFGLNDFMEGRTGFGDQPVCNIFAKIAELSQVPQDRLSSMDIVTMSLSTVGGVDSYCFEEVLGEAGLNSLTTYSGRAIENSYGVHPSAITLRFHRHWVRVEGMELRAKSHDVGTRMSETWEFKQGDEVAAPMAYPFSKTNLMTGRLPVRSTGKGFVDKVEWQFPKDFCLEHIVLHGYVTPKAVSTPAHGSLGRLG